MKFSHVVLTLFLTFLTSLSARADQIDLQTLIEEAVTARQKKVIIPPGVHRITPAANLGDTHVLFRNVHDLEIDGTDAKLIFTDPEKSAFSFDGVQGLTLKGFTIDYDPLPFTQGTIMTVGNNPPSYDVKLDAGYPSDEKYFASRVAAYIYEPVGRKLKDGAFDHYIYKISQPTPGIFHVEFENGDVVRRSGTAVGDRIVISRRAATAIWIFHSSGVSVEGITVYTAPGMAFHEAHGEGCNRYQFTMTYGPPPAGATAERLHTATADGVHSSYMHVGPIVMNCRIEGQGDDAIAIHDNYSLVVTQGLTDTVVMAPKYELPMEAGDEVRFLDQESYGLKAKAKVLSMKKLTPPVGEDAKTLAAMWQKYRSDVAGKSIYQMVLDRKVDAITGDLASSYDRTGAHFVVKDNYIGPHRGRGILIKAPYGVVEGNTIEGSNFCGILLGPELSTWLGGDYAAGVVVKNNVIRRTGYSGNVGKSSASALLGAISVQAKTLKNTLAANYENAGIVIENNQIERPAAAGIFVSSARDVKIVGNSISEPWSLPGAVSGMQYGVKPGTAIYVEQVLDLTIAKNQITPADAKIETGPAARNIQIDTHP